MAAGSSEAAQSPVCGDVAVRAVTRPVTFSWRGDILPWPCGAQGWEKALLSPRMCFVRLEGEQKSGLRLRWKTQGGTKPRLASMPEGRDGQGPGEDAEGEKRCRGLGERLLPREGRTEEREFALRAHFLCTLR